MCTDCTLAFFQSPLKLGIVIASILISLISLVILRAKSNLSMNKKIALIYIHIFGLIFPIFFYIFFNGCSALFSSCGTGKATFYLVIATGITAAVIGAILAPLLFLRSHRKNSQEIKSGFAAEMIEEKSGELGIRKPKLYLLKTPKPVAFSFSMAEPVIFISAGMADILSKKEVEAVLLHELSHIKNSSSKLKLPASLMKILSPASHVASFRRVISAEEKEADIFAIKAQGTAVHINSVKEKLSEYEKERGG